MKFYSEVTKKLYDTAAEVAKAEAEVAKRESDKKMAHDKVVALKKAANTATEDYEKALKEYIDNYGAFVTAKVTLNNVKTDEDESEFENELADFVHSLFNF